MRDLLFVISILVFSMITSEIALATAVDVYAEGGYSDTGTTIKIFADINPDLQGGSLRMFLESRCDSHRTQFIDSSAVKSDCSGSC